MNGRQISFGLKRFSSRGAAALKNENLMKNLMCVKNTSVYSGTYINNGGNRRNLKLRKESNSFIVRRIRVGEREMFGNLFRNF